MKKIEGDPKTVTTDGKPNFNPDQLIPRDITRLSEAGELIGEVKIAVIVDGSTIRMLFYDQKMILSHTVNSQFGQFEAVNTKDFPELIVNERQCLRPLMYASFEHLTPDILHSSLIETADSLRNKGLATAYQETLTQLARSLGYRFIVGYHNFTYVAKYFLNRGRYLVEEIKEEYQSEFDVVRSLEDGADVYFTVRFLRPEDIEKYVKPEAIGASIDERIKPVQKLFALSEVFDTVESIIESMEGHLGTIGPSLVAGLIGILDELNMSLPEDESHPSDLASISMLQIKGHEAEILPQVLALSQYLSTKKTQLVGADNGDRIEEMPDELNVLIYGNS